MKLRLFIYLIMNLVVNSLFSLESTKSRIHLLSFDSSVQNYFPIGRYAMYSQYNYGLTSQLNLGLDIHDDLRLFTALSLSNNMIVLEDVKYIVDLYFVVGAGWSINLDSVLPFNGLTVTPGFGYGWMPHIAEGGYWTDGESKTHFFQDQIIISQIEFAYSLKPIFNVDYTLLLTPSYVHFLEEEYDGQELGFNIGVRIPIDRGRTSTITIVKDETPIEPEPVVVKRDEVPPGFKNENPLIISDITPSSATIALGEAYDNSTPEEELIYRVYITREPVNAIESIDNFTKESVGENIFTIDNLTPETTYYVNSIVMDVSGNYSTYRQASFETDKLFDMSGFKLGNQAIEVDLRKVLEVEFNTDINQDTINSDTIYVRSNNYYIKGELEYKDRILRFIPQEDFLQGKEHEFVLTTELEDIHGNTLLEDVNFTFTALDYNDIFAHWKFDYNTFDSSGNDHTATLKSLRTDKLPTYMDVDQNGNGGLHFVGGYNWGTYIDLGTIDMGDTFTIAGWVFIEEPPEEYSQKIMTLISNGDAGAQKDGFKVFFNNWSKDDKRIVIETGNGTNYKNSETQDNFIEYNNWYHVAVTIDRNMGIVKLYFNGKEAETTFGGAIMNDFNTNAPLHIGHFKDGFYHYNGYIDDFRIYKKVISAEDIEIIARGN